MAAKPIRAADLEELFGELFGAGVGRRGRGRSGAERRSELPLTIEEAYQGGSGKVMLAGREYQVTIPAGVAEGERIRLSGPGGRGDAAGELYLVIRVLPHAWFRLSGRDLGVDLLITPSEGVLGATMSVPTPGGPARVVVPAGSSTGRRLRLRGQGMPNPRGAPGDLYADVRVVVPPTVTGAEREVYQRLSEVSSVDPRDGS